MGNSKIEMYLASIQKRTHLLDWGDPQFLVPLTKLVEAFEETYSLQSGEGEVFIYEMGRLLTNRLIIQNELTLRPDILETPIEQPLFILGLPRSGTTLLHHLLAQDPKARAPLYWEMLWPVPVGGLAKLGNRDVDPRIAWAEQMIHKIDNPKEIHELKATNPEECHVLLMHTFMCPTFSLRWNVPSYDEWLKRQDMTSAYGYYKILLQFLLWAKPGNHLVLKDPAHLDFLADLVRVFPKANFVWLHRDPGKVVPSFFNLMQKCFRDDYTISDAISSLRNGVDNGMKARNQLNQQQFLDVYYHDLVANPLEVMKKIYQYFNYPWTSDFRENAEKWRIENPKNKHGRHNYDLAMFGVEPAQVQKEFADYCRHFSIPTE